MNEPRKEDSIHSELYKLFKSYLFNIREKESQHFTVPQLLVVLRVLGFSQEIEIEDKKDCQVSIQITCSCHSSSTYQLHLAVPNHRCCCEGETSSFLTNRPPVLWKTDQILCWTIATGYTIYARTYFRNFAELIHYELQKDSKPKPVLCIPSKPKAVRGQPAQFLYSPPSPAHQQHIEDVAKTIDGYLNKILASSRRALNTLQKTKSFPSVGESNYNLQSLSTNSAQTEMDSEQLNKENLLKKKVHWEYKEAQKTETSSTSQAYPKPQTEVMIEMQTGTIPKSTTEMTPESENVSSSQSIQKKSQRVPEPQTEAMLEPQTGAISKSTAKMTPESEIVSSSQSILQSKLSELQTLENISKQQKNQDTQDIKDLSKPHANEISRSTKHVPTERCSRRQSYQDNLSISSGSTSESSAEENDRKIKKESYRTFKLKKKRERNQQPSVKSNSTRKTMQKARSSSSTEEESSSSVETEEKS